MSRLSFMFTFWVQMSLFIWRMTISERLRVCIILRFAFDDIIFHCWYYFRLLCLLPCFATLLSFRYSLLRLIYAIDAISSAAQLMFFFFAAVIFDMLFRSSFDLPAATLSWFDYFRRFSADFRHTPFVSFSWYYLPFTFYRCSPDILSPRFRRFFRAPLLICLLMAPCYGAHWYLLVFSVALPYWSLITRYFILIFRFFAWFFMLLSAARLRFIAPHAISLPVCWCCHILCHTMLALIRDFLRCLRAMRFRCRVTCLYSAMLAFLYHAWYFTMLCLYYTMLLISMRRFILWCLYRYYILFVRTCYRHAWCFFCHVFHARCSYATFCLMFADAMTPPTITFYTLLIVRWRACCCAPCCYKMLRWYLRYWCCCLYTVFRCLLFSPYARASAPERGAAW